MASEFLFRHRGIVLILLALLSCNATAFGFGKKTKGLMRINPSEESENLTTLLRPMSENRSKVYTQAMELLTSIQASPSCQRLATSNLLDSCQSIDGSQDHSEAFLDDTRSVYAAQLAICEIKSANAIVPQTCEALSMNHKSKMNAPHRLDQSIIPKAQLSHCLQHLESRPQWWTSYSNNRQNAVVICEAVRSDVEKDEIINLHMSSIQINRDADAALSQAVEFTREVLQRQHQDFALVKRAFQEYLLQDVEIAGGKVQSLLESLMTNLNTGLKTALSGLASRAKSLETEITSLYVKVNSMNTKSQDLEKHIGKVFQEAVEGTAELASIQTQHLHENDILTQRLQTSLKHMREVDVHNLVMVVQEMQGQMQTTSDLIVSVSSRQSEVDHQMNQLGQVLVGLQKHAQSLQDAQFRQESIQARLHNAMEAGFNASLSRLFIVERSATKLQSVLQEASQSIAQMTSFAWIMSSLWKWGSFAIIPTLVACTVFSGHTNIAKSEAAIIATLFIIKCILALLMEVTSGRYPFPGHPPIEPIIVFGFATGLLIAIGWFYKRRLRLSTSKSSSPMDSSMYHIGRTSSERKLHSTWRI